MGSNEWGYEMKEKKFITLNSELHRRQARIRKERERNEPVHIGQILPGVMNDILRRSEQQRRAICG
jgi:hypothetical protein